MPSRRVLKLVLSLAALSFSFAAASGPAGPVPPRYTPQDWTPLPPPPHISPIWRRH